MSRIFLNTHQVYYGDRAHPDKIQVIRKIALASRITNASNS
ncbi:MULTISPECIES: hypothetical protein [unclassified Microcoleus]